MADGPAGLRLRQHYEVDRKTGRVYGTGVLGSLENGFLESPAPHADADTYYQFCTAFPVGTALAQTWDTELLTRIGRAVSREMEEFHVDLWLAPGMNLQRNPLCGRNFEYFSEDPLLSGILAAAITRGVQASGRCGVTLKHFACNNQEDNRMAVDARVSERALRELYLRGFEIAVKAAAPAALMTAYNCVNGVHASNSRDLCTVLLRQEWGFDGLVLSDWNTTVPSTAASPGNARGPAMTSSCLAIQTTRRIYGRRWRMAAFPRKRSGFRQGVSLHWCRNCADKCFAFLMISCFISTGRRGIPSFLFSFISFRAICLKPRKVWL